MATLLARKSKKTGKTLFTVQFVLGHQRPCVPLGSVTKAQAGEVKGHIERLVGARRSNAAIDGTTAAWLADVSVDFYARLVEVGLVEPRETADPETPAQSEEIKLAEFVDRYISERDDVKPGTALVYNQVRRNLIDGFGADKPLGAITTGDAKDWRRWLTRPKNEDSPMEGGQGLNENTDRKRCAIAKQIFADAVDRELIGRNPYGKMEGLTVGASEGRDYFVTPAETAKVLAACPDAQWKLLFALSRYGGLRCPSEHLGLRWGDVDFEHARIVVRSPKTARHEGKAQRVIPLFPELRPYLEAVRDELLKDFDPKASRLSEQPVITHYRDTNANLRTQLLRIIARAKLATWPKLFQNLRASRATELAARHPGHVAAEWMGHSTKVADKHYWRVTDSDFDMALRAAPCAAVSNGNKRFGR